MRRANLFTMLSAYKPGSRATPFENYCTSALAYLLMRDHRMLRALFAHTAGVGNEPLADVEVQPRLADAGIADLLLTYEGGRRVLVEVQVESGQPTDPLPAFEAVARGWLAEPAFILLGLGHEDPPPPWKPLSWLDVVDALEDDPDPLAQEFMEFVLRDILGLGPVPLDQALSTNRLYALGAAAVRRRFGPKVRYVNSASPPTQGKYRYLGTTFSLGDEEPNFWIGIVNEEVPLSDHYHLMLASKNRPLANPVPKPRATGNWKWPYWTGLGRVVRPLTLEAYDELLSRIPGT